jgi:hypothetical protein
VYFLVLCGDPVLLRSNNGFERNEKHCFLVKKNTVEAKAWLDKHYMDSAPAKSTVEKWFAKFKRGKMSIEDDARSRRPLPTKT